MPAALASVISIVQAHDELERVARRNTLLFLERAGVPMPQEARLDTVAITATIPAESETLTVFHSRDAPKLTLFELSCELRRRLAVDEDMLVAALALIGRYCSTAGVPPSLHLLQRLYVAAVFAAVKIHRDACWTNAGYAAMAGLAVEEINRMEVALFKGVRWHLLVDRPAAMAVVEAPVVWAASLPNPATDSAASCDPLIPMLKCLANSAFETPTKYSTALRERASPITGSDNRDALGETTSGSGVWAMPSG